ncbi:ABC transporter permease [Nocardioides sp.]|uniref:ABC transporter permease n=1 Tax=Nocardioides sp. TaxID=35761 RepID=UPI002618265B|nr:ABC transporter permease [Nocardioides sp.]
MAQVRALDLVDDVVLSLQEQRLRSLLSALSTALGVGVVVVVLGLTATVTQQVDRSFDALTSTEVTISQQPKVDARVWSMAFPADVEARIRAVAGVRQAGLNWEVPGVSTVSAGPSGATSVVSTGSQVLALSPSALREAGITLEKGRFYDGFAESTSARVALIGPGPARDLGISRLDTRPAVFVNGTPFTVVGILADTQRHPELLGAVVLPLATAVTEFGQPEPESPAKVWVEVKPGAAQVVARQLPIAVDPANPAAFGAVAPPDPRTLRQSVNSSLTTLFYLLAAVCLVVGMVGIANTAFISVLERVGEIGLRRALGARRRHVVAQFLGESVLIGSLGGLAGSLVGVLLVIAMSIQRGWSAVVPPWLLVVGPALGAITGLIAGIYPALKAAKLDPAEALRSGT